MGRQLKTMLNACRKNWNELQRILNQENSESDLPQLQGISALAFVVKPVDSDRGQQIRLNPNAHM
jgi:hypothetical protein